MRRLVLISVALQVALCGAALAQAPKPKRVKIAVLDVKSQGLLDPKTFEGVGPLISSELSEKRADLTVVSASDIKAMIGFEREKQLLGCSEGGCLAEIGGALGVDYILSTSGSKLGGTWLLSMSLIDVVKQRTVKQLTKRTEREGKLVDVCLEAVQEVARAIPVTPAPAVAVADPKPDPKPDDKPAPVEDQPAVAADAPKASPDAEVKKAGGRSKAVTGVLIGIGAGAVVIGGSLYGLGVVQSDRYAKNELTRKEAQNASLFAPTGIVLGVVGVGLLTWGIVRAALPDAPQVSLAPTRDGVYASVTLPLP